MLNAYIKLTKPVYVPDTFELNLEHVLNSIIGRIHSDMAGYFGEPCSQIRSSRD